MVYLLKLYLKSPSQECHLSVRRFRCESIDFTNLESNVKHLFNLVDPLICWKDGNDFVTISTDCELMDAIVTIRGRLCQNITADEKNIAEEPLPFYVSEQSDLKPKRAKKANPSGNCYTASWSGGFSPPHVFDPFGTFSANVNVNPPNMNTAWHKKFAENIHQHMQNHWATHHTAGSDVPSGRPNDNSGTCEAGYDVSAATEPSPSATHAANAGVSAETKSVYTASPHPVKHDSITCDGCNSKPIEGNRFKCIICPDYNLCGSCFSAGMHQEHTMLVLRKPEKSGRHFVYCQESDNNQSPLDFIKNMATHAATTAATAAATSAVNAAAATSAASNADVDMPQPRNRSSMPSINDVIVDGSARSANITTSRSSSSSSHSVRSFNDNSASRDWQVVDCDRELVGSQPQQSLGTIQQKQTPISCLPKPDLFKELSAPNCAPETAAVNLIDTNEADMVYADETGIASMVIADKPDAETFPTETDIYEVRPGVPPVTLHTENQTLQEQACPPFSPVRTPIIHRVSSPPSVSTTGNQQQPSEDGRKGSAASPSSVHMLPLASTVFDPRLIGSMVAPVYKGARHAVNRVGRVIGKQTAMQIPVFSSVGDVDAVEETRYVIPSVDTSLTTTELRQRNLHALHDMGFHLSHDLTYLDNVLDRTSDDVLAAINILLG